MLLAIVGAMVFTMGAVLLALRSKGGAAGHTVIGYFSVLTIFAALLIGEVFPANPINSATQIILGISAVFFMSISVMRIRRDLGRNTG